MHIGLDCRYLREPPSGIGAYVEALAERLPDLAPSARFRFWAMNSRTEPLPGGANVTTQRVPAGPNSPFTILWPRAFLRFDDLDLFHGPHNILPCAVPCPSVVTIHDVLALDDPTLHRPGVERFTGLYYPQAVRRALRRAACLIAPTAATADRVLAWEPSARSRIFVIPMAPHACFQQPDVEGARREATALLGDDAPYLLVVGQNSIHKGHETAMAAFATGTQPPVRLVLLQRLGSQSPSRRLARRLSIEDRVVWLRHVSRDQVAALMTAAEALVQPSLYEGFGLPAIEAMAAGCPVIASDIPAVREVTGGAALLVNPRDVGGFAGAIRSVLSSPEHRRSLSAQGRVRAKQFSWDRTARDTHTVYLEAVNGRPASAEA